MAFKFKRPGTKPRILFIFTEWAINEYRKQNNAYGGVGYYRTVKPAQALQEKFGDDYEIEIKGKDLMDFGESAAQMWVNICTRYDMIVTKVIDNPQAASNMLAACQHFGVPVIVDVDDDYFNVRPSNPAYELYQPGGKERSVFTALIELADGMFVSTEPLKALYTPHAKRLDVLPNCNDVNDWKFELQKKNDGKIRIGYSGSLTHNDDLDLIVEPMKRILQKYPNVVFEILGAVTPEYLKTFKSKFGDVADRIEVFYGTPAWEGYPLLLSKTGWDIGIAPLVDDTFNRGKSHIKWMEYAMYKIPTVASAVYPYHQPIQGTKTIDHGKTGFLIWDNDPEKWFQYLSDLVEKPELRAQVGQQAFDHIQNKWQWSQHIDKWKEAIDHYLKKYQEKYQF